MKPHRSGRRRGGVQPHPRSRQPFRVGAVVASALIAAAVAACGPQAAPTRSTAAGSPTMTAGATPVTPPATTPPTPATPAGSTAAGPSVAPEASTPGLPSVGPTGPAAATPTPSGIAGLPLLFPLPADLIARGANMVTSATDRTAELGRPYSYGLEHCGILSPIDFDGSMWDPVGAQDGRGQPISADQEGELINGSRGTMTLVAEDTALYRTASGLILGLTRHVGPRGYPACM